MAERIIESGRYKSCSILVAVTDWMSRPNLFLVSTVSERTALHWERLEKKDPTGRKLYWQTAVVLFLWSLSRRVNLWDPLMKMVSVVRFQEVRETFLASTLIRSHSRICWRDSCRGVWNPLAKFIDTECKRVLVSLYRSSACVDDSTPVIMLSIDMLSAI